MGALARLEGILQELMERPQWLLGARRMHPLELAATITRALESQVLPVGDRTVAPNRFSVRLNPADHEEFGAVRRTLERELAEYVGRAAKERGLTLPAAPIVEFIADAAVRPGAARVEAAFDAAPPPAPATVVRQQPMPAGGFTERIDRPADSPFAPPPATAHAALDLLDGVGRVTRTAPLDAPFVTIGRRSGNDIALLDIEVSRQHARIDYIPPRYYISDLGSTNGTRVNGRPVSGRHPLNDGDLIELGASRLRFRARG